MWNYPLLLRTDDTEFNFTSRFLFPATKTILERSNTVSGGYLINKRKERSTSADGHASHTSGSSNRVVASSSSSRGGSRPGTAPNKLVPKRELVPKRGYVRPGSGRPGIQIALVLHSLFLYFFFLYSTLSTCLLFSSLITHLPHWRLVVSCHQARVDLVLVDRVQDPAVVGVNRPRGLKQIVTEQILIRAIAVQGGSTLLCPVDLCLGPGYEGSDLVADGRS